MRAQSGLSKQSAELKNKPDRERVKNPTAIFIKKAKNQVSKGY